MLTLQELKQVVSNREERRKVPSAKYLRENDVAVAKQRLMDCAEIIAYQTGYVLYCVGDYATVFPLFTCRDYVYEAERKIAVVEENFFDDQPWYVTSSNTDMDELNSIMLGGDAFITKPYNPAILLAKIAALLKKAYRSPQTEIYMWREATLHLESSMIEYKGQKAELTKNELKILYYLFKNAGKICSRNDIVDFLWDNQLYVDDNALSVNITRIRDKLAAIGLVDFIKTKHRQGYTL